MRVLRQSAFTLIEVILYVAIVSIMATTIMLFSIQIVQVRGEAQFDREVNENLRFAMDLITREIRDASAVTSVPSGSHPDLIGLDSVLLNTDTKTLTSGRLIRFIQFDGSQITSDKVDVTNFVLTDLQRDSEPENIQIMITVEALDGSASLSLQSSASLRER